MAARLLAWGTPSRSLEIEVGRLTTPVERARLQRRRPVRRFLQWLAKPAFSLLTDLEIHGQENFPEKGPLLVVGNHFSMVDTAAFVRAAPYPIEFIGGAAFANAPGFIAFLPRMWGYLPVFRGTGSHFAMKEAEKILRDDGVLAIFPEGGSWARVLRPPRPGAAFLASRTGARILPVGLVGMDEVFSSIGRLNQARIAIRIGRPFGPFKVTGKGRKRREQLNELGHEIMRRIAELIPPEKRGYLSTDPQLLAEAKKVEKYPWADRREGEVKGTNIR